MATIIQINVIDVSAPQTVKTAKGSYQFLEVAYKREGKVEGKKVMDFGHNEAKNVFNFLKHVVAGDVLDISLEKVNDYWTWVGAKKAGDNSGGNASQGTSSLPVQTSAVPNKNGRVVGSNYETPEERAARQRLIVRQSSLTAALTLLCQNAEKNKAQIHSEEVLKAAETFVNWVFEKSTDGGLMSMEDDIPV
jgi:hypothetical protein